MGRKGSGEIFKELGIFIKEKRNMQGITLDEASELIGISKNFLNLVENGKASMSFLSLLQIMKCLKITEKELFSCIDWDKIKIAADEIDEEWEDKGGKILEYLSKDEELILNIKRKKNLLEIEHELEDLKKQFESEKLNKNHKQK